MSGEGEKTMGMTLQSLTQAIQQHIDTEMDAEAVSYTHLTLPTKA